MINEKIPGNTFEHTMLVLDIMSTICQKTNSMLAALTHDLGKTKTSDYDLKGQPLAIVGKHHGHENRTDLVERFCKRYGFSRARQNTLSKIMKNHMKMHLVPRSKPDSKPKMKPLKIIRMLDEFKTDESFQTMINLACADAKGRLNNQNAETSHLTDLILLRQELNKIKLSDIMKEKDIEIAVKNKKYEKLSQILELAKVDKMKHLKINKKV